MKDVFYSVILFLILVAFLGKSGVTFTVNDKSYSVKIGFNN